MPEVTTGFANFELRFPTELNNSATTQQNTFLYYWETGSDELNALRDWVGMWLVFGTLTAIVRPIILKLYYILRGPKLYIYSIDPTAKPISNALAAPNEFPCKKSTSIILMEYFHLLFVLKMAIVAVPFMLKSDSPKYLCFWSYILMNMLLYSLRNYTFQPFALKYFIWLPTYQFSAASNFAYLFLGLFDPDTSGVEYWYSHFAPPIFLWVWLLVIGRHYILRSDDLIPMVSSFKHSLMSILGGWPLILFYLYFNNPNRTYNVAREGFFQFIPWVSAVATFTIIVGTQIWLMGIVIVFNRYYQYLAKSHKTTEKQFENKKEVQIFNFYVESKEIINTEQPTDTLTSTTQVLELISNSSTTTSAEDEIPKRRRVPTEIVREVDQLKAQGQPELEMTNPEPLLPTTAKPSFSTNSNNSLSSKSDILLPSNATLASGKFPNLMQTKNARTSNQAPLGRLPSVQLNITELYKFIPYTNVKNKRRMTLRNFVNKTTQNPPKSCTLLNVSELEHSDFGKAILFTQSCYRRRKAKQVYAKLRKYAEHRFRVVKEILSTEETFVSSIKLLKEEYLIPLREEASKPNALLTKQDLAKIFSDIEVILNVNEIFLSNLKVKAETFDFHSKISDVFIPIAPFFKVYTNYCNNYDHGQEILRELKKKEEFGTLLKKLDANAKTKLGMSELLILPIQRVPRYRLLLQDLLSHTDILHPDYNGIEEAISKITEVANHLNTAMKEIDMLHDMKKLQELFNPPMNLIEAHRKLVKDGELSVIVVNEKEQLRQQKLYLHLFNDILIYSRKEKGRFTYNGEIQLSNALLFDSAVPEHNHFQIKLVPYVTLILLAASKEEKYEWLENVNRCIQTKLTTVQTIPNVDNSSTIKSVAISGASKRLNFTNEECIRRMKKGATLLKYTRKVVKPHFREFVLSNDCMKLTWTSSNNPTKISFCNLADVKKLVQGQRTLNFTQYKNPALENYSFSLLCKDRSLDIVCKDEKEFVIWTQGFAYLISEQVRDMIRKGDFKGETIGLDGKEIQAIQSKFNNGEEDLVSNLNDEKQNFKDIFEKIGDGYSFGQNLSGCLGHGNAVTSDVFEPTVIKDFLFLDVDYVDTENSASAMVTNTGEVFVFGKNDSHGRLGLGDTIDRIAPTMIKSLQEVKIKKVSMGFNHTIALDSEGRVYVWGGNNHGQLGLGINIDKQLNPTLLDSITVKVVDIEAGSSTSALIGEDGLVYTFGLNDEGQLGHGNKEDKYRIPTIVEAVQHKKIVTISMGLWHSLILAEDGALYSCGQSTYGQLGHGNFGNIQTPKQIESLRNIKIVQIAAGSLHSACISNRGDLYVFGNNTYGQLGNGTRDHCCIPTRIQTFLHNDFVKQVACGSNHCLCLMKSGKVFAFGAGTYGRLGLKDEQDRVSPTLVTGFLDKSTRFITAGGTVSMAVCSHQWLPDKSVSSCMNCNTKFTFFTRRHHCRYCGGIYCNSCTLKRCAVLRFGFDTDVRVCDTCYSILTKN